MAKAKKPVEPPQKTTEELKLATLVFDQRLQMRCEEMPTEEYEELLSKSKAWPFNEPLRGVRIDHGGDEGHVIYIYEGFTRGLAAINRGRKTVPVEHHDGTFEDALKCSLGTNSTHGFRRTPKDKAKAVQTAITELKLGPTLAAQACNVSRNFVYDVRKRLNGETVTRKSKAAEEKTDQEEQSEIKEECPICGSKIWNATAKGHECANCRHQHGEPSGDSGDDIEFEEVEDTSIENAIVNGTAKTLEKAEAQRGRLIRELDAAGLLDACRKPLAAIGEAIAKARKANIAE